MAQSPRGQNQCLGLDRDIRRIDDLLFAFDVDHEHLGPPVVRTIAHSLLAHLV